MKVPIALRIFLIGIVVLLVTAVPIFLVKTTYAQTVNCTLNIYPQPTNGTNNYTVTLVANANVPFVEFTNNWYGGNDTIGYSGTGTINSRTYPQGWTRLDHSPYEIRASSANSVQQVTYEINLTLNNGFGGIDIGASRDNSFSKDLCTGHLSPTDITYNPDVPTITPTANPSPSLTPAPTPTATPTPTPTPTVTPTPTPTPSSTPTPTPTPTVTPTPTPSVKLNVLALKQTDKPWNTQIYDGANFWSPLSKTINSWGCALTSYSMVLKYFGINKLPNGTILDPGTLNTWLKSNNGYIDGKNSGYLNPLAISSLSHQAIKINKITAFDGLEYSRATSTNTVPLIKELNSNHPVILEEPGHYVVAIGTTANSFSINDPYYNRTDLTYYNNSFTSLNELKPAHTDLSYILLTADKDATIQIRDAAGNPVGQTFLQQPLVNADTNQPAGDPIKVALVPQPTSGDYTVTLTSQNADNYTAKIYFYDQNGNLDTEEMSINATFSKPTNLNLNFDKRNINHSTVSKIASFDSLIADIKNLESNHEINPKTANNLINSINKIQKNYNKKFKIFTQIELKWLSESLRFHDKKSISKNAVQIITSDINDLIKSL